MLCSLYPFIWMRTCGFDAHKFNAACNQSILNYLSKNSFPVLVKMCCIVNEICLSTLRRNFKLFCCSTPSEQLKHFKSATFIYFLVIMLLAAILQRFIFTRSVGAGRVLFVCLFVQGALNTVLGPVGIPTLTMPFVLASWLFLVPNKDVMPSHRQ